jgi:phenylpyruvate tautomerase PptA (4-oxalocrotonate tautomerase family)
LLGGFVTQVKVYGLKKTLEFSRQALSEAIWQGLVEVLGLLEQKPIHRFVGLSAEDFLFPADRSDAYIIEILMVEGRSVETKRQLIRRLFENLEQLGWSRQHVEIVLLESPAYNWGIRGSRGDALSLTYNVKV